MPVTISYLQTAVSTTDASTYTFSAQSFGTAASDRYIAIAAGGRIGASSLTISSVTIGGVSATIVKQQSSTGTSSGGTGTTCVGIAIAAVPSGATGDVVVNFSATSLRCVCSMWRLANLASATANDSQSSTASPSTAGVAIPLDGAAIGMVAGGQNASPTVSWTNLTEQYDALTEAFCVSSASDLLTTAETRTITGTFSAAIFEPVGVFASWAPADYVGLVGEGLVGANPLVSWGLA
jgi:hypothetical protein